MAPIDTESLDSLLPLVTNTVDETVEVGRRLGALLQGGDVVALLGDVGAGKTHLTKGIAASKGVATSDVTSPTFAIVNIYYGSEEIYHIDTYRAKSIADLLEIGIDEYLYGEGICIIEWPSIVEELLPEGCLRVELTHYDSTRRRIAVYQR